MSLGAASGAPGGVDLAYEAGDEDFVRFRDSSRDDAVQSFVRGWALDAAAHVQRRVTAEVIDVVRLFAMRRTLGAHRRASAAAALDALTAFALLPHLDDVPWDSWLKGALVVVRSIGGDLDAAASSFTDVARPGAIDRFRVACDSLERVATFADCRLEEVHTTYGAGFVETLVFRDKASPGWLGTAPRLGDRLVGFRPRSNLAQLAVSFADAVDASGATTGPIGPDQLAAGALGLALPGSYVPTSGCLSFVIDDATAGASFSAFVAELAEDVDLAAADSADAPDQSVVVDDGRLIVIMAQPDFGEDATGSPDPAGLAALASLARQSFASSAATWRPASGGR